MQKSSRPEAKNPATQPRRGTAPKYGLVADALRQQIVHGTRQEGDCLPSLHELAEEFGVARLTARNAVQVLVQEGLLASMQGRGTYVTGRRTAMMDIPVQTTLKALSDSYLRSPPEIRTLEETIVELPARLGDPDQRSFVRLRRVHAEAGVPYCVIAVHIDQKIFRRAPKRFRDNAAVPVLVEMLGLEIKRANQTLTVRTVDAETAELLEVPQNSPGAYVERVFKGEGDRVFYFAEVIYRGDLVKLDIELRV